MDGLDEAFEVERDRNGGLRDVGVAGDRALGNWLVVDPGSEMVAPAASVGGLRAKVVGVRFGNYRKPNQRAAAFDVESWFRIGGLGKNDEEGYLRSAGRLKQSFRCGGDQVLRSEVEEVLTANQEVVQGHMRAAGWDRIVNFFSTAALGNLVEANDAAAKAGIEGPTKRFAIELDRFGL